MSDPNLKYHECDREESWPEYDAQGIYLCRVCPKCQAAKLSTYRPEILSGYSQADVDEPIEPEPEVVTCDDDFTFATCSRCERDAPFSELESNGGYCDRCMEGYDG